MHRMADFVKWITPEDIFYNLIYGIAIYCVIRVCSLITVSTLLTAFHVWLVSQAIVFLLVIAAIVHDLWLGAMNRVKKRHLTTTN